MKYDIIVIGSGPGGYVAAVRAAQLGKKTAVIEKESLGGTCLNWGCIPTKALLKSAKVYHYCRNAATYGITGTEAAAPDMDKIVARSRTVASNMNKGVAMLLKHSGVDVIEGFGKLVSATSVDVDGVLYEAGHIILATGARPREMPFMPIDHTRVITSKDALALDRLPQSIVVVGSGAIGCEFAHFYASLGAKVTIVEYMPQIMPLEDEEVAKSMERAFRKLRVGIMTSTTVKRVVTEGDGCKIEIENAKGSGTLEAEVVLSAVGIKSNIENIGLEQVGITVERDKIVVNNHLRTSVPTVYAIGDIVATPALAHIASAEAVHCVEHICGLEPEPIDYSLTPSCIFTSPEVASVGLTEKQAVERGMEYTVGRYQFAASGKAMASGERDGFVKLIFDADKHLVGAHMVGENVAEMLGEPSIAMALGASAADIAKTIHSHPTMSEGIMESAAQADGSAIHA